VSVVGIARLLERNHFIAGLLVKFPPFVRFVETVNAGAVAFTFAVLVFLTFFPFDGGFFCFPPPFPPAETPETFLSSP
jgi:hypothetical protein